MRRTAFAATTALWMLVSSALSVPARADDAPAVDEVTKLKDQVEALTKELEVLRKTIESMATRIASLETRVGAPDPLPGQAPPPAAKTVPPAPVVEPSPAERTINAYLAYTDLELRDPDRGVTVDMLLAIVADGLVPKEIRERAAEAIIRPQSMVGDPDLSMDGRPESRRRSKFSARVVKLDVAGDPVSKALSKRILDGLWVPGARK